MQKILDLDSLDQHFDQHLLHFDAPDQNPLDLIGFPVGGSCRARR
jgi:hypothetical protein